MATAAVTNQFTASTTIVSDDVDTNFSDLVTFLNGSVLHLDGAKAMTGDLDMGQQDINNVPWKTYAPTYNNFTLGNGSVPYARYIEIGDLVHVQVKVILGSTSSVAAQIQLTLPVTAAVATESFPTTCTLRDATGAIIVGSLQFVNTTTVGLNYPSVSGALLVQTNTDTAAPFPWTTSDFFAFDAVYEKA
ncbi:hypothetical protein LCGC14_2208680 [marine sediment metagenome]|uniref:Uncharacterized protein n=1 Tax=marine sediment metagenome TaxID=412755 RepID=A0A0F9DED1_9ZZZZ